MKIKRILMKQILFLILIFFFSFFGTVAQQKKDFFRFPSEIKAINDICFTNNGGAIGIADNKSIKVYSTDSHELIGDFTHGHRDQILSIDISRDSTYLVSGGRDSTVVIWDFKQGMLIKSIKCSAIISAVCLSPNNQYIVYGGTDKSVSVYDIQKGEMSFVFSEHSDNITAVAFSPDGRYIASSSGDKKIHIYEKGAVITTLSGHKDWVRDISFNSDGTRLISCDDNGFTFIWNLSNINNTGIYNISRFGFEWLLCVDFHQDDKAYAIGDIKGNVKVIGTFGSYKTNVKSPVNRILFKPNETYIKIAVATRGEGVLFIEALNMKSVHK
jgi:WD40 repeat protein